MEALQKCNNNPLSRYKRLEEAMNKLNQNANRTIIDNNNGVYYINILNPNALTLHEKQAILITHTSNVTFNSFAAEVEFHADALLLVDFDIPFYTESAIKADMSIDEEFESGITDQYYNLDGSRVTAHKLEHGEY